ncbi:MAG: EAL domain-containing protein, partial [Gammaproteobacteria bacterium]|nr:EAL domain-containing protein [Gammaproteobacteria bacterium]
MTLRLLTSVALSCALITTAYYLFLQQQFNSQRSSNQSHNEQLLSALFLQSEKQQQRLIDLVTALPAVTEEQADEAESAADQPRLQGLDMFLSDLEYPWNLQLMEIYSSTGDALAKWSAHPINSALSRQISNLVSEVRQSHQPLNLISCQQRCSHYLVAPLGLDTEGEDIIVIATSLLELLNQFHLSTDKIVGLLTTSPESSLYRDPLMEKWGYSLYSLTDAGTYDYVLRQLADKIPAPSNSKQSNLSQIGDAHYELSLYPLASTDNSQFLILQDISAEMQLLHRQTGWFALILLAFLLPSHLVLRFFILRSRKATRTASDSPSILIDNTEYQTLAQPTDDTDADNTNLSPLDPEQLTSSTLLSITDRLHQLKHYHKDINQELARQIIRLGRERDLVRKILDNTQAIIITLKQDGSIKSINRYGQMVTGYTAKELKGKNFIDLYPDHEPLALNDLKNLATVATGDKENYRHEARLSCKDGREKVIMWLHSRLHSELDRNSPLLAAGLDITEHKQLEQNLSWLADHDSLTSLYNRRRFEEELNEVLYWATNYKTHGALLYIDLDNFKDINDSSGHRVGDIILRKVARALTNISHDIEPAAHPIVARLGGDEFAIILRHVEEAEVVELSQRILAALKEIRHTQNDMTFQVSSSIGIACFPGIETNANELLSNADYAMYQAKLFGRNQFYIFREDDNQREQSQQRIIWRDRIECAIREHKFILHYQPILDIAKRKITHYETLIRLRDEDGKVIQPSVFINIAERLGLIQQIDSFIVSTAIAKLAELGREGHDIRLSVNLSAKAFDDPELFNHIKNCIQQNQVKAENLIFEITETTALSDLTAAEKIMSEIQSMGCQFALDDFGMGFSSFYYLRELPVEYVKIDGSFVKDLANNADNQVLVKALSEVAIGFNKLSVAEFVDSYETLQILSKAKVNYAQGYF